MDEYEINSDTLCIIPIDDSSSMVYEFDGSFIVSQNTKEIINNSCLFYGSTYDGRKEACSIMLDSCYKIPIIIDECANIIFFPTVSDKNEDCAWISFNNCIGAKKIDPKNCMILFKNNKSCRINFSCFTIHNQLIRSNLLNMLLTSRKKA